MKLTLGEAPPSKSAGSALGTGLEDTPMRGVEVTELTAELRLQLGLRSDVKGVVVAQVPPGSPAAEGGLRQGDVIEQVARQPVQSVADYDRSIRAAGKKSLVLLVNRGGATTFIVIQPG